MHLYNYQAERSAKQALMTLREELAINVKYSQSIEKAASACEMLCIIARTPNHYLGLELINVLGHSEKHHSKDISAMVAAFMKRIEVQIQLERNEDPAGEHKMLVQ